MAERAHDAAGEMGFAAMTVAAMVAAARAKAGTAVRARAAALVAAERSEAAMFAGGEARRMAAAAMRLAVRRVAAVRGVGGGAEEWARRAALRAARMTGGTDRLVEVGGVGGRGVAVIAEEATAAIAARM